MKEKLESLLANAYCPYSNFSVSAILVTKDGKEFCGVNVEDASTRAGTCAERNAIFNAITNGYKKGDFKEINLMGSSDDLITPCFICRQLLIEFFEMDDTVKCYSKTGEYKEYSLRELCPYPFSNEDLK